MSRPDRLSLVVYSGDFDKVHYALVMASAAAATGMPATVFLTMGACRAFLPPHADGTASWRNLPTPEAENAGALDDGFAARGVATFEELVESAVLLNVRFLACEMGLRALDLSREDLRPDVPFELGGVATFLADASRDGAMVFI